MPGKSGLRVIVVGAGLAGLACASDLVAAGAAVRVLEAGEIQSGASVHFVVPELDAGPVIAQASVPVHPGDSPDALAVRIRELEHKLYPAALRLLAEEKVKLEKGLAVFS